MFEGTNIQENVEVVEEEMSMEDWLSMSEDIEPINRGSLVKGTIISYEPGYEILMDIGYKSEGIVKSKDLERVAPEYMEGLAVGEEIYVYVVNLSDEDGYVLLSLSKATVEQDWVRAKQYFEDGETFEGEVTSSNKGGLIVNFGGVRGFVPGSQLDSKAGRRGDKNAQWESLIGETLLLKIIEVDRRRNRLILSERAAVDEHRKQQKADMLANLSKGDVIEGRVSSLADFGAFVDLGAAEGLVHLSELSWTQIGHPREVLKVGDTVEVYILNIDEEKQRIGLSLKRLQPEPWSQALDEFQPGEIVEAIITKITNFGAFARVANKLEGLIHISELSHKNVSHPRDVVKEKETVQVRIISIEPDRRRMGLSIKQAQDEEVDDEEIWEGAAELLGGTDEEEVVGEETAVEADTDPEEEPVSAEA